MVYRFMSLKNTKYMMVKKNYTSIKSLETIKHFLKFKNLLADFFIMTVSLTLFLLLRFIIFAGLSPTIELLLSSSSRGQPKEEIEPPNLSNLRNVGPEIQIVPTLFLPLGIGLLRNRPICFWTVSRPPLML